jgi:hypothetical protein
VVDAQIVTEGLSASKEIRRLCMCEVHSCEDDLDKSALPEVMQVRCGGDVDVGCEESGTRRSMCNSTYYKQ